MTKRSSERGSAVIIVIMCFAILLTLFTVALRAVYDQHKNNRKVLKQVQRSADRLDNPVAEQQKR